MNIHEEFERLKALASTRGGLKEIDDVWMVALDYEKREGYWYKKADAVGAGRRVSGFAIDINTKRFIIGPEGRNHEDPFYDLVFLLASEEDLHPDDFYGRIVKGHLARVEGWSFMFLNLFGLLEKKTFQELETFILDKGIGLPVRLLFEKHRKRG